MATAQGDPHSVVLRMAAAQVNRRVAFDMADADFSRLIEAGRIVILRGVFAPDQILDLRRQITDWGRSHEEFPPGQSASRPGFNFHRRDDGGQPSHLPHLFHVFGFGAHADLPVTLRAAILDTRDLLLDLHNRLAGTAFDLRSGNVKTAVLPPPQGRRLSGRARASLSTPEGGPVHQSVGTRPRLPAGRSLFSQPWATSIDTPGVSPGRPAGLALRSGTRSLAH